LRLPRGEAPDAVSRESLMTAAEIRRHCRLPRPAGRLDDPKLCRPWGPGTGGGASDPRRRRSASPGSRHWPARPYWPPRSTSNPAASRPLVERSLLYDHW